ncbi:hypothetical protein, partial [Lonsdalea iberica]|uniref:hypothetical protein n=1 Tax=Lonsdalea iberica TaxID=1082703 RepID=UPI00197B389D
HFFDVGDKYVNGVARNAVYNGIIDPDETVVLIDNLRVRSYAVFVEFGTLIFHRRPDVLL